MSISYMYIYVYIYIYTYIYRQRERDRDFFFLIIYQNSLYQVDAGPRRDRHNNRHAWADQDFDENASQTKETSHLTKTFSSKFLTRRNAIVKLEKLSFHVLQQNSFDENGLVKHLARQNILVWKLTRQSMFVKLQTRQNRNSPKRYLVKSHQINPARAVAPWQINLTHPPVIPPFLTNRNLWVCAYFKAANYILGKSCLLNLWDLGTFWYPLTIFYQWKRD